MYESETMNVQSNEPAQFQREREDMVHVGLCSTKFVSKSQNRRKKELGQKKTKWNKLCLTNVQTVLEEET